VQGPLAWKAEVIDWAVLMVGAHYGELAPHISPVLVQHPWVVELEGYPYDLAGIMDVVDQQQAGPGGVFIRDTKTGKVKYARESLQLTMYAMAWYSRHKVLPAAVTLDNLKPMTRGGNHVDVVVDQDDRTTEDCQALLRRIEAACKTLEAGAFPPCNPDDWMCSPKWCGYHDRCPYVRHPVTVPVKGGS
jgi:hypothetical protein